MECQFTLVDFDAELMKLFGLVDGNAVQVTLRGALCDDNSVTPMVISLRGMYKELDFGKFKAGDKGTLSASVSCRYYKLNINNSDVIEIDVDNMIRKSTVPTLCLKSEMHWEFNHGKYNKIRTSVSGYRKRNRLSILKYPPFKSKRPFGGFEAQFER